MSFIIEFDKNNYCENDSYLYSCNVYAVELVQDDTKMFQIRERVHLVLNYTLYEYASEA